MKYYYQIVTDSENPLLLIYDKKSVDEYINKILKFKENETNNLTGPGVIIEFDDKRYINPDLKLNYLDDIDMSTNVNSIKKILNKSLIIEHLDIIENMIKKNVQWIEFTRCSTELKIIVEILLDRYIKYLENEEKKMNKVLDKRVSTPKVKYKMGDEVTLKLSKLDGIITGIIMKESYREYEVTYYCNEYRRVMVSQHEITKGHSGEKPQTIGFRSEPK